MVKNLPANIGDIGDMGSILGLGRSLGREHGNPLWYSCLGNPIDRGAWRATVPGLTGESDTEATQLSYSSCLCIMHRLECLSVSVLGFDRLSLTIKGLLIISTTSWPLWCPYSCLLSFTPWHPLLIFSISFAFRFTQRATDYFA